MNENLTVRTANKSDIDTLIKFRFFYQTDIEGKLTEEQTKQLNAQLPMYFEKHIGKDLTVYLAEVNGETAASVFMVRLEKPASVHFLSGKTCYLMNVYTVREHRCKGIASMLLDKLIADARSEGITCIDLSATEIGKPLYLKKGFAERGNTEMRMEL